MSIAQAALVSRLKELREQADKACEQVMTMRAALRAKKFANNHINYADLGCHSAEKYFDDTGGEGFRVTISEAAPDCDKLCQYIHEYLKDHGFPGVDVVTEW
jgi:hypothetical protein